MTHFFVYSVAFPRLADDVEPSEDESKELRVLIPSCGNGSLVSDKTFSEVELCE